jgi:hypothetical protein
MAYGFAQNIYKVKKKDREVGVTQNFYAIFLARTTERRRLSPLKHRSWLPLRERHPLLLEIDVLVY